MGANIISGSSGAARRVMDSLRRLVQGLRVFDREAERAGGISGAQLFVLSRLADGEAASVNELAERTCTHQSSVSVVAQKLVDRGFVNRDKSGEDRRQARLTISAAGRKVLAKSPAAAQEKLIAAISKLSPGDRENLARLLERLVEAAGLAETAANLFFEDGKALTKIRKPASHD